MRNLWILIVLKIKLSENTNLEYTIIDIGAEKSVSNYYSNIVGNEAKNDLKTVLFSN